MPRREPRSEINFKSAEASGLKSCNQVYKVGRMGWGGNVPTTVRDVWHLDRLLLGTSWESTLKHRITPPGGGAGI